MGFKIINGRTYYYRSRRIGERVLSEYCGTGRHGEFFHSLDAADRAERLDSREAERSERKHDAQREHSLDELVARVQVEATAHLQALGYHRPKRGPWRRRRCPK